MKNAFAELPAAADPEPLAGAAAADEAARAEAKAAARAKLAAKAAKAAKLAKAAETAKVGKVAKAVEVAPLPPPAPVARPSPLQFQLRVAKALVLRDLVGQHGDSRLGPIMGVFLQWAVFAVMIVYFRLKGKTISRDYPLLPFFLTGFPLWFGFMDSYRTATAGAMKTDGLLMFPQIAQLDLIISKAIVNWFMASVSTISIGVIAVVAFGAPAPNDAPAVILFYWACMWIGFAFGLVMSAAGRPFPHLLTFLNLFLRFGLFFSGVVYTIDRLPAAWWPYLEWNPILQAVEGARQAWYNDYQSPIFSISYLLLTTLGLTFVGLILERATRRFI